MYYLNKYFMVFLFLFFLYVLSFVLADGILLPLIYIQVQNPDFYKWGFFFIFILWLIYHLIYEIKNTKIHKNNPLVHSVTAHLFLGGIKFIYKFVKRIGKFILYVSYVVSLVIVFLLILKMNEWLIIQIIG